MGKRLAFCISIIALAGCGGAQQLANGIPQGPAASTQAAHSRSWMLPEAESDALLYVADGINQVNVFSYPKAKPVGTLTGFQSPAGMCPDKNGNIWITNFDGDTIVEYAHGGTTPINTLKVPKLGHVQECAVDPTSGDLAVVGYPPSGSTESARVIVYAGAKGPPKIYHVQLDTSSFCTYDPDGNLFVDGYGFHGNTTFGVVKLENGARRFKAVSFSPSGHFGGYEPEPIQWDGRPSRSGPRNRLFGMISDGSPQLRKVRPCSPTCTYSTTLGFKVRK